MKKTFIVISFMALAFASCKNDKKTNDTPEDNDSIVSALPKPDKNGETVVTGDFIYTDNAAVINGNNFILGVVLDSMAKKLADKVEPIKEDQYDMIPVTIKGKIIDHPKYYEWDHGIKINKILFISKSKKSESIKLNGDEDTVKLDRQNNQNT